MSELEVTEWKGSKLDSMEAMNACSTEILDWEKYIAGMPNDATSIIWNHGMFFFFLLL